MAKNDVFYTTSMQHKCSKCSKAFKHMNHLRRHEASHTKSPSHQCQFCSRNFTRNDVLRRHFKTCSNAEQQDAIPEAKRGRKSRACERCRSKKLQCDNSDPCKRCLSAQVRCSFSSTKNQSPKITQFPMKFMLNYTNPVLESVSDAFAISEAHAELSVESAVLFDKPVNFLGEDCMADLFSGVFSDFDVSQNTGCSEQTLPALAIPSDAVTQRRAAELIAILKVQHESQQSTSPFSVSEFSINLAIAVFTGRNLVEYVLAFFQFFHPHTPFIHRPTFDINMVSPHLLIATFLVGSIFRTPQDDALTARCFFGLAEDYIFKLLRDVISQSKHAAQHNIQIVQAAVLIHALQVNSNHEGVRLRVRVNRFPEIVAAMRRLGFFSAVRVRALEDSEWKQFVGDEVIIRLAHRVFTTDCMNTLFFKNPPQVTIAEMCGDLSSTDELFDASEAALASRSLATSTDVDPQPRSLKDLVSLFLNDEKWLGPKSPHLASIRMEHLMCIIFALNSAIFVSRTGLLLPSTQRVLQRALTQWKEVYHVLNPGNTSERPLVGFAKYALELWWLAQKILEVMESGDMRDPYMKSTPTDSLKELHDFIRRHQMES